MLKYEMTMSGRRVYPPLQWRPLRVMVAWQKALFLVGAACVTGLIGNVVNSALPSLAAAIVVNVVSLPALIALARSFRGWGEPAEPPRAWWRLTARPTAGWVLGVLYILTTVFELGRYHDPTMILNGSVNILLGVAFIHSSIRLHRMLPPEYSRD